jgi:lipopolysaccharide assembly protein A
MKTLANIISSILMAVWIVAIAIFSIQNIQDVSLRFLVFESINFPLGVLLALCGAAGIILGSLLPLLWQQRRKVRRNSY